MKIKIFTTGGTIDKVYFDDKSTYEVGDSLIDDILKDANVGFEYECERLMCKDSLRLTDDDRQYIKRRVESDPHQKILITHGTDTMTVTAQFLDLIQDKTIVLTGSIVPARFKSSDAVFNIGFAIAALQCLPPGVFIAMNGRIFKAGHVIKNVSLGRFQAT